MTADDLAWEQEHAARMARHAFDHEVESYGIADGMQRRPVDPLYAHEPAYLSGHRTGLALPPMPDTEAV